MMEEKDNETAIKDFLLDIDCLEALSKWSEKFNLFDVLKISRTEIRHSNMLAWFLTPDENHGFGDKILKGFVQYVIKNNSDDEDVFSTLLMDYHDFIIQREWHNIDLIAISEESKFILCIENKIDSGEHDDQLNRYRKIIEEHYSKYKKYYIFLSPNGLESSDPEYWIPMSYQDVLEIIEKNKSQLEVSTDIQILVENYIEIIKRDILKDEELAKICRDIYFKHQKALDLIYENRPDKASGLFDIIKKWAAEKEIENKIIFCRDFTTKSISRFRTINMDKLIPESDNPNSGWKSKNHYFYEIQNSEGKEISIKFVLNSDNINSEQKELFEKINTINPSKLQKENWQWRTHFSSSKIKDIEEIDEEVIKKQLDKLLSECLKFENELINKLK